MSGNAAFFDHFLLRSIDRSPQRSPSSAFFLRKNPIPSQARFATLIRRGREEHGNRERNLSARKSC